MLISACVCVGGGAERGGVWQDEDRASRVLFAQKEAKGDIYEVNIRSDGGPKGTQGVSWGGSQQQYHRDPL